MKPRLVPVEQEKKLTTSHCFFFSLYVDWCFSDALHIYIYTYVWRFFFFFFGEGGGGGPLTRMPSHRCFLSLGFAVDLSSLFTYVIIIIIFLPCFSVPFPGVTACNGRSCVKRPHVQHFFFFFGVSSLSTSHNFLLLLHVFSPPRVTPSSFDARITCFNAYAV